MFIEREGYGLKIVAQSVELSCKLVQPRPDAYHVFGQRADLAAINRLLFAHRLHVRTQSLQMVKRNALRLISQ